MKPLFPAKAGKGANPQMLYFVIKFFDNTFFPQSIYGYQSWSNESQSSKGWSDVKRKL